MEELKLASKKTNGNIDKKISEFKAKTETMDSEREPGDIKKIEDQVNSLEAMKNQLNENINNFKTQKREIKDIALRLGIASEKTLKNARKYMKQEMKSVKETVYSYIEKLSNGEYEVQVLEKLINMMNNDDNRKGWLKSYNKIESCSKRNIDEKN